MMTPNGTDPTDPLSGAKTARKTRFSGWSSRKQMLIWGGVTVAVLAVVILVVAAVSPWRAKQPSADTSQIRSQLAYDRALLQEGSGETTEAVELLKQSVALDPDNSAAQAKLEELQTVLSTTPVANNDSVTENSNSGSKTDSTKDDAKKKDPALSDAAWMNPVKDLKKLLPTKSTGYELGLPIVMDTDATRSGTPKAAGTLETNVIWTVHDMGGRDKAKRFVEKTTKVLYSKDGASVKVDGVPAYFGTDGMRFASVAWARGRFAFEVVVTSEGPPPKQLKTVCVKTSESFPDKP